MSRKIKLSEAFNIVLEVDVQNTFRRHLEDIQKTFIRHPEAIQKTFRGQLEDIQEAFRLREFSEQNVPEKNKTNILDFNSNFLCSS